MGLTFIEAKVKGPTGKEESVNVLVDSGAKYTLLPQSIWQSLGLSPKRRLTFTLADGTPIDRDVSEAYLELSLGSGHTPVIMGEEGDEALLGVVTLEELGLVLNPFQRSLQPARMMLA